MAAGISLAPRTVVIPKTPRFLQRGEGSRVSFNTIIRHKTAIPDAGVFATPRQITHSAEVRRVSE